jgi:pimeloyl-ACP methyl ester carboxylesterase
MAAADRRTSTLAALVAVLAAVAWCASPAAAEALRWHPCTDGFGADCARLVVPLDRSGALAGTVGLRVAQIPGPARGATLVYLSGGPGSGGLDELESILWSVSSLTSSFRVVTFDQRGTGASGLLRCPEVEHDARLRSTAAGAACAGRLGPARSRYTTADSVEDLEAVRRALGVERLTLLGISYGTELALAYARAHPDHVERLALDSVVDPADADPFGLAGFRAMGPTLAALCPARCRGVSASPVADLARLTARLRRTPLRGRVVDAHGRASTTRALTPVVIADLLYDADYQPALRAGVPAGVAAALRGDAAPLLRLAAVGDGLASLPVPSEFSSARYAAICEETPLPWDAAMPPAERMAEARRRAGALGAAAFRPFDFDTAAADEIALCLRWPGAGGVAGVAPSPSAAPPAPVGADPPAGGTAPASAPYPDVPALLLQGGEDLRTPPEVSARVAAELPGAVRVLVPGVGHGVVSADPTGCATGVLLRFLTGGPAGGGCRRVSTGVPAVHVPPPTLRAVSPLRTLRAPAPPRALALQPAPPRRRAVPTRIRRIAAAVGLTLDDVRFALSPAFPTRAGGGLRGGTYRDDGRLGLRLAGYEAVGGVRISGRWHGDRLVLAVGGRVRGAVAVSRAGSFRGTLEGVRVAGRFAHAPPQPVSRGGIARVRLRPR